MSEIETLNGWRGKELFVRKSAEDIKTDGPALYCWLSAESMEEIRKTAPMFTEEEEPAVFVTVTEGGMLKVYNADTPITFKGGDVMLLLKPLCEQRCH